MVQALHILSQVDKGSADVTHHHFLIQETFDEPLILAIFLCEVFLVAALKSNRIVDRLFLLSLLSLPICLFGVIIQRTSTIHNGSLAKLVTKGFIDILSRFHIH
jgi:hypothetical protein